MSSVSKILRIRFPLATGTEQVFCKQKNLWEILYVKHSLGRRCRCMQSAGDE